MSKVQLCKDCDERLMDFGANYRCTQHPRANYVTGADRAPTLCEEVRTGPTCDTFRGKQEDKK